MERRQPQEPAGGAPLPALELTAADRTALEKVYGKLPPPPAPLPPGVIAEAGFNDAKGLNNDPTANSPYPLDKSDTQGGFGERWWQGAWPATSNAKFVKDPVAEGDGALFLTGTTGYGRVVGQGEGDVRDRTEGPLPEGRRGQVLPEGEQSRDYRANVGDREGRLRGAGWHRLRRRQMGQGDAVQTRHLAHGPANG